MISEKILKISQEARNASRVLAKATSSMKNNALKRMAERIIRNTDRIISANKTDLEEAKNKGLKPSLIDRLTLTPERLQIAAAGIMEIISLPDPVGAITKMWRRPNGLVVGRMRIPIGVILIIYEARPNVTLDAAGLCVKSGNAVILRGGTEALNSNRAIAGELKKACAESDIPADAVQIVPIREREAVLEL
ncbi:MAG TPA: gamma-glutamyl-phosphate reductase, partial [bacterium]